MFLQKDLDHFAVLGFEFGRDWLVSSRDTAVFWMAPTERRRSVFRGISGFRGPGSVGMDGK